MTATLRNATLQDLATVLEAEQARKIDVVVRSSQIRSVDGALVVPGAGEPEITLEGVTAGTATMRPTEVCDGTMSDKLGIPRQYLRRLRTEELTVPGYYLEDAFRVPGQHSRLIDAAVNAHLMDLDKPVLVRGFTAQDGGEGVARALLSDQYQAIDHLDCLYGALDGIKSRGTEVEILSVDLSERNMRVRFLAPSITALAPKALNGYRPPTGTQPYGTVNGLPVVFAGFELSNSETGGGAFRVVPRIVFQWCSNGMTRTKDLIRSVHVGGKLEDGPVRWSAETQQKNLDLIRAKAADAVTTFLDTEYLEAFVAEIEAKAEAPVSRPEHTITVVAQRLRYTEGERETLLSHFIGGGQATAAGVMNAVTSMAQTIGDPDRAADIEASALEALDLAAATR